jgi:IMP dehydrogenase
METLSFDDVTLVPNLTKCISRSDVDISRKFHNLTLKCPILAAPMDTVCESKLAIALFKAGGLGFLHRFMDIEKQCSEYEKCMRDGCEAGVAIGFNDNDRLSSLYSTGARIFLVDVANAYSEPISEYIIKIRDRYPDIFLIGGNVCTHGGALYLQDTGVNMIRCGQGSGSVCVTRVKTGFGIPQFTAVQECAKVGLPIISDGSIRNPGDIAKALVAGASFVMIGRIFAGTAESSGHCFQKDKTYYKSYHGMASRSAHATFGINSAHVEGIETSVPYIGYVADVINEFSASLRSALSYGGCKDLNSFGPHTVNYRKVSSAGYIEGTAYAVS